MPVHDKDITSIFYGETLGREVQEEANFQHVQTVNLTLHNNAQYAHFKNKIFVLKALIKSTGETHKQMMVQDTHFLFF